MKNKIQISGIVSEPTTAQSIASNLHFDTDVKKLKIEEITGKTKVKGNLTNGILHIDFSTHFKWGFQKSELSDETLLEKFKQKLIEDGLQESQCDSVIKVIEDELNHLSGQTTGTVEYLEESKKGIIGGDMCIIEEAKDGTDFPLPNFPLDLDVDLDVKDTSVDSVKLSADTAIMTDSFQTGETTVDDFEMETELSLPFQGMELDQTSTPAVNVPKLTIPNVSTSFTVEKVTSPEIQLSLESKSGSADIDLKNLVNWHPRWKHHFGFTFIKWYIGIWVEFGINLTINLHFKLLIDSLNITLKLSKLVLNGLSFTLKLVNTVIINTKLGILKIAKIVGKMLPGSKK